jgi:hypothetical protein
LEVRGELLQAGFADPLFCLADIWRAEVPLQDLVFGRDVVAVEVSVREASKQLVADELFEVEVLALAS